MKIKNVVWNQRLVLLWMIIWIRTACVTIYLRGMVVAWPITIIHLLSLHSLLVKPCNGSVFSKAETYPVGTLKNTPCLPSGYDWHDFCCTPLSWNTLLGTNISLSKAVLKLSFLFPRWDMLIPWRVPLTNRKHLFIYKDWKKMCVFCMIPTAADLADLFNSLGKKPSCKRNSGPTTQKKNGEM